MHIGNHGQDLYWCKVHLELFLGWSYPFLPCYLHYWFGLSVLTCVVCLQISPNRQQTADFACKKSSVKTDHFFHQHLSVLFPIITQKGQREREIERV